MFRLQHVFVLFVFALLSACSVNPSSVPSSVNPPVKPSTQPTITELVGIYRLFAGSEISYGISEQNGSLFASLLGIGQPERLLQLSPTRYKFSTGEVLNFTYSQDGKYDRFTTRNEGRSQQFIRDDALQISRTRVTNQSVYTNQLVRNLKPGSYAYSRFLSPSRGLVDYSVYLPQEWRRNNGKTYPLVFFLHGQTGWERSFPDSVPATQLNQWISSGSIPPLVIVSLRTGRLRARVEEQWSSARNENLLTSESSNELRAFVRQQFRAGMSAKTTSIHGHSRGSRGAIHYALKYPRSFSSAVANAFVSDYALPETKRIAQQNLQQIHNNGIPLRISIGDRDEFAVNMGRKASPMIHQFLNNLQIPHDYEVFRGVNHGFVNIWNTKMRDGIINGLAELQLHAGAWKK